jgi:hypothetical protein
MSCSRMHRKRPILRLDDLNRRIRLNVEALITDMVKRRMTFVYSNEEPILFMRHKLNIRKRIHVVVV